MKKNYFLFFLLLIFIKGYSERITMAVAEKVAKNFIFERAEIGKYLAINDIKFSENYTETDGVNSLLYIFNIEDDNGFIITSADDRIIPILCYSLSGSFNINEEIPPAFKMWIENYKNQVKNIIENNYIENQSINKNWDYYLNFNESIKSVKTSVSPLLTTNWGQGCYYNEKCPYDTGGYCDHVVTGCGATAMAMIMKYWNYPINGTGSHSYTHPTYGLLSADFAATTYDWLNMPDVLTSSSQTKINAVSTLMYHCGVSVDMNYGPHGSSSFTTAVRDGLVNYFKYSSDAVTRQKSSYSDTDWMNMLRQNLDAARPVLYRGEDPTAGGHIFVCDGYQGTSSDYFHFNWGWNGSYNCYCYLNNLSPSATYNFSTNQFAIFNVYPLCINPIPNFTANIISGSTPFSVTFTDNSTTPSGSITSRKWDFGDGTILTTTNTSTQHTYNYAGTFNVSLTIGNSCGSSYAITKTNYITANGSLGCDTSSNITSADTLTAYSFTGGCKGYWTSQNCNGWSKFAEKITANGHNKIYGAWIAVVTADYGSSASTVNFCIYEDGPVPGSILGNKTLQINTFTPGQWKYIEFATPISTTNNFYFGYEVNYIPGDTFGLYCKKYKPTGNTAYVFDDNQWKSYPEINSIFNTSLGVKISRCNVVTPIANFIADTTDILINHVVSFTNQSTKDPWSYLWTITPNTGFVYYNGTNSSSTNPKVNFTASGGYTIKLTATNPAGNHSKTRTNYIHVADITGISELSENNTIKYYPNPVKDFVIIDAGDLFIENINVYNSTGQRALMKNPDKVNSSKYRIKFDNLPAGMYFIEVKTLQYNSIIKVNHIK